MRSLMLAMTIAALVCACSDSEPDTPPQTASDTVTSDAILKKDCADPKWRTQNLGLWYSVCRQPMRW